MNRQKKRTTTLILFSILFLSGLGSAAAQDRDLSCELGERAGIDESEAGVVVALVCEELESAGASGQAVVDVRSLGDLIWVTAGLGDGTSIDREYRLQANGFGEVPVVAERLAESLVRDVPIAETATVQTLVGEETRQYDKLPGEFLWGVGLAGASMPGTGSTVAPGLELRGAYQTGRFEANTTLRFALSWGDESLTYFTGGVGGRYHFLDTNLSPFVGTGLNWLAFDVSDYGDESSGSSVSGDGFAAHVELGVEMLRFHDSRLAASFRAELPFFTADEATWSYGDDYEYQSEDSARYVVPVGLSLTYSW